MNPRVFVAGEHFALMAAWYGALYCVVEGWVALGLHDDRVDSLLASDNTALLRRFRNASFQFQRRWVDHRFVAFCTAPGSASSVRSLHDAFAAHTKATLAFFNDGV